MDTQAKIVRSTIRLQEIKTLLGQNSLKHATAQVLEAYLGEANGLLALEPYSSSGSDVLSLVRAGVVVWETASALVDEYPGLASPYVDALLGEMPALLLKVLERFRPWFQSWVSDTGHDVAVRMCLDAQGLYRPGQEPRESELGRKNSPEHASALAEFVAGNVGLVVKAAFNAGSGRWPEHGYPGTYEVEAIKLFHRIRAMTTDDADTVDVTVRAEPLLLLAQLF